MGEILQKRFSELETIEKKHEDVLNTLVKLSAQLESLKNENENLKGLILSEKELSKREREIEDRERNYEITVLKERLRVLELSKNEIVRLSEIAFKQVQTPPSDINIWGNLPVADNFGNVISQNFNAGGTIAQKE